MLAAVATTDDMLTYREYQLVQEAAQAIFGERALHAELQAKLHYALLNPPSDPADIARDMANQADAQKVSSTFVDTMLKALSRIGGQEERIDEKARSLVNDIEWAFRKSRLERSAGRGIGLGLNVGESLGELYRKATNVLPSRKEIAGWFAPETSQFNADMERFANSLDRIAWTLDDMDLREELYIFRKMLRRQPFKIVIVGERKRGKSSLINAIIGQELSPVRESTPETATVVEFKYAHAPDYSVRFLDSSQFARLEDYLENEQDNLLLTRKIEHIRNGVSDGTFIPGKLLSGITCWDDLSDYISLEGRFSGFVARVSVGLPLDTLRAGVVLVDTPGLNDTDQFHDYLSYEESLEADCVIFVMDARDPGSNSELSLLRKLARSGCTVSIIGVDQHRLPNNAASLEAAREQARTVLREACRARPCGTRRCRGSQYLAGRRGTLPGRFRLLETLSKVSFRVRLRRA
ncbi:MAG: dynamin family protein [Bilophila wadsworthia]